MPAAEPSNRRPADNAGVISPLQFLSGGVEFAVICAAGALAGRWIDGRLGTEPWFTVALIVLAFASGTWLLLRGLTRIGSAGADAEAGTDDRDPSQ